MKFASIAAAAATLLFSKPVTANFYIYDVTEYGGISDGGAQQWSGYKFFKEKAVAASTCQASLIGSFGDVSGPTRGVRCSGCTNGNDPEEFEANLDNLHFTLYKGEGYQITPADGGPLLGHCEIWRDYDIQSVPCGAAIPLNTVVQGISVFWCQSPIEADEHGILFLP